MAFKDFADGYKKYKASRTDEDSKLAEGQSPDTLMISCSDSRVDTTLITGSKPGQIFSIENVAAIAPAYDSNTPENGTAAAIEYAVKALKVKNIVVMGHSCCGGCGALAHIDEYRDKFESIAPWMENVSDAIEKIKNLPKDTDPEVKREALEHAVVLESVKNLMTYPFIAEAVKNNELEIHGWHFDIKTGTILEADKKTGQFLELGASPESPHHKAINKSKFAPK